MNKQIAKLAAKSGFDVGIHDGLILGNFSDMYKLDKFAELLIQECITVVNKSMPEYDCKEEYDNLCRIVERQHIIEELEQNFGIDQ